MLKCSSLMLFSIIFLLIITALASGQSLFPIYMDGKGGYINSTGEIIIQPQFEQIKDFSEGLAAVRIGSEWGYINKSGILQIPPQFINVKDFSDGLAIIIQDKKLGYIDKRGKIVIQPIFEDASHFHGGIARVKQNNKWMVIGKDGLEIFDTNFEYIDNFSNGWAVVVKKSKDKNFQVSYINLTGKLISTGWLTYAGRFADNLAVTSKSEEVIPDITRYGLDYDSFDYDIMRSKPIRYEVIDISGRKVFEKTLDYFGNFSEGLAPACVKKKCGYIDNEGNIAIDFRFDSVDNFSEGLAQVKIDNENFIINKSGKKAFKIDGTVIKPFKYGLVELLSCKSTDCNVKYLNSLGETIWRGKMNK